MTPTLQELAQALVSALDELLVVHEAQKMRAEESRQKAQRMHDQLMQRLHAMQSGETAKVPFDYDASLSKHTSILELGRRWAVMLSECDGLLMRLYAFSEARESAETIADALRAIRLMSFEDDDLAPPRFDPAKHFPPGGVGQLSEVERKQKQADMALDFFAGMDDHVAKVQQGFAEKSLRTEQLLRQARDQAETLRNLSGEVS